MTLADRLQRHIFEDSHITAGADRMTDHPETEEIYNDHFEPLLAEPIGHPGQSPVEVVVTGRRRDDNEPYIWLGLDDECLGSLDEAQMIRLRNQINEALEES